MSVDFPTRFWMNFTRSGKARMERSDLGHTFRMLYWCKFWFNK